MTTIQELASELSQAFEGRERDNGEKFRTLKDGSPEWMTEVCRAAHDSARILPDDYRYQFIEEAADALSEHDDTDDARDSLEPSVYTHELTRWLHSSLERFGFVDEVIEEYGPFPSVLNAIAAGMQREMQEVFDQLLTAIQDEADSREAQAAESAS